MLYKKNLEQTLSDELFRNPTAEYRGTPFWAWNCELKEDELLRQIELLKEMGFGGFHMHVRSGMNTVYLSDEHMRLVRACTEKAKAEEMLAWLYDEDRWPSGSAGGYVTKDRRFSAKGIFITQNRIEDTLPKNEAYPLGKTYFLSAYDVSLNTDGSLASYRRIDEEEEAAAGEKWYVYVKTEKPSGWFNDETYVDTLSKEAIDRFIEITHETYNQHVSDFFGKEIPAIFTDEPHFYPKETLRFANEKRDLFLPWTNDFDQYYKEHCGLDLLEHLPELIWELPDSLPSPIRYHYHDLICEAFCSSFADNCGSWCREHGIELTGHVLAEATLHSQTYNVGEAMRTYRSFGIPGIDMLCDLVELSTAKQAQSVSHQYGKEGVLSELYGVTNWDFDFRGHKFQGDWQAALGVTVRVPHLSWVSMKGSAKRDYPASIHYQSPWYREYSYIEDHFARLATALTRGKPKVKVCVIHPIESFWLKCGPADASADARAQMENNFQNLIDWLLFGTMDFDFISESLLPSECGTVSNTLQVGAMEYSAVIVPGCLTLRSSTLEILKRFQKQGGKVIFVGEAPQYVDALPNTEVQEFYAHCEHADFNQVSVLSKLSSERTLEIKKGDGYPTENLIYQMREDGDYTWLFIAHGKKTPVRDNSVPEETFIRIIGEFEPVLYNTLTGAQEKIGYTHENGKTVIPYTFYAQDSLLLRLAPSKKAGILEKQKETLIREIRPLQNVDFSLEEPNVYLLDLAEYSVDGGETFAETEELLRIDKKLRKIYDYPQASGEDTQPWAITPEPIEYYPILRFTIESEIETAVKLAYEEAEEVILNGESVKITSDGFFTDHEILTMPLPMLRKGTNTLLIKVPIGKRVSIENFFLLGDFGVRVIGTQKTITAMPKTLGFGSITHQGLPFYGGNVLYKERLTLPECRLKIRANYYRGALIKVLMDGKELGRIAFDPFCLDAGEISAGEHEFTFILYGNRFNSFGALHACGDIHTWFGPSLWYTEGDQWSYEYMLKNTGILSSPIFECYEK